MTNKYTVFTVICHKCGVSSDCPLPIGKIDNDIYSCINCNVFLGFYRIVDQLGKTKEELEKEIDSRHES